MTVDQANSSLEEKRQAVARLLSDGGRLMPASFSQERLWFLSELGGPGSLYNLCLPVWLEGVFDEAALRDAVAALVARHESLRTRFVAVGGKALQFVEGAGNVELAVRDLRGLAAAERMAQAGFLTRHSAERGYDLAKGPLFRALALVVDDERQMLVLSMHHIVSDAWSMQILAREVVALYGAFRLGEQSPLPPLALQYADFAGWQREQLQGARLDSLLSYWREQLKDAPALVEMGADRPRPLVQSYRGATQGFMFSKTLSDPLLKLGREAGATSFMTLLAAFTLLLFRRGAGDHVVIGAPVANRTRRELEGLVGFFVNTLVLHLKVDGQMSFRELLAQTREVALGAHGHQDLPFERLVEDLKPERSLGHTPIAQVMFSVESAPELIPQPVPRGAVMQGTAKFDLTLQIQETRQGLYGMLEYATDLFDDATATALIGHYERLLQSIAENPDKPIARLDILPEAERNLLVEGFNDTSSSVPSPLAHQAFEHFADMQPDAVAVGLEEHQLTYGALERDANRLANRLIGLGVGPDIRVAIALPRSLHMIVAVLAVHKAGGCYVPLDPAYPAERLALMLDDSRAEVLISTQALALTLPSHKAKLVLLDRDARNIEAQSSRRPNRFIHPDHLAYVIYTSGSTGRPKGVMVPHRGLRNVVAEHTRSLFGNKRVLQFFSLSFDVSAWEIVLALAQGATLVLASEDGRRPGEPLQRLIACQRIDSVTLLPSVLASLDADALPYVRQVVCAAEALPPATVRIWAAGRRAFNGYGPTETSICSTLSAPLSVDQTGERVPIGRPILNTSTHIVDGGGELLPQGIAGELLIGGDSLARGYLGQPAMTARRFIPDANGAGTRLYRTGDLVRWTREGELDFLGRIDRQVKLRGFRIELGEIEAALGEHPAVEEAVVLVQRNGDDDRLLGYVVARERIAADALKNWLRARLPDHMLPAAIAVLDALPRAPNGKVDLIALARRETEPVIPDRAIVSPETELETVIVAIWAKALGIATISTTDNFFDLGGHSLLATRILAQIQDHSKKPIPLKTIFQNPTVQSLANAIEGESATPLGNVSLIAKSTSRHIERRAPDEVPPLSFAQEWFWFIAQMQPDSPSYNIAGAFTLPGPVDSDILCMALNEVVRRHEPLRSSFASRDGQPYPVIASTLEVVLETKDLGGLPPETLMRALQDAMRSEAALPFDLSQGPLIRATLMRCGEHPAVLLLTLHHIITDGVSMALLLKEIGALYGAFVVGDASPLDALPISYGDYAKWQRDYLQGDTLAALLAYWRKQLTGAPPLLELPTDRPRPAVQGHEGATLGFALSAALSQRVIAQCRARNVTPFMLLLAAFKVLLYRRSGQDDIVIGSPIANRHQTEVADLIGLFVNTLILRTSLAGNPSFRAYLDRVRTATLEAYAHQELPFGLLVQDLRPKRSLAHNPIFQVLFNLHNMSPNTPPRLYESAQSEPIVVGAVATPSASKFDLELAISEGPGGFHGSLEYNVDLFDQTSVETMLRDFAAVLDAVSMGDSLPLQSIPLSDAVSPERSALPTEDFEFA